MAMHVRTEGDKSVFSSARVETFANLYESKPHIIIIFHLKTNRQKLEKPHVNGSQTRILKFSCDLYFTFFFIFPHDLQVLDFQASIYLTKTAI